MELTKIKKHLRITNDMEDDEIQDYIDWSEALIKSEISIKEEHLSFLDGNKLYEGLVRMVVAHAYTNRLPVIEGKSSNFIKLGYQESIELLFLDYMMWVDKHEN